MHFYRSGGYGKMAGRNCQAMRRHETSIHETSMRQSGDKEMTDIEPPGK
jgi:hypothetical protein